MNKNLLFVFGLFSCLTSQAQVIDGAPLDSTIIRFTTGSIPNFIPDTAATPLWQIGHSHKLFFGDSTGVTRIMTDTLRPYPVNANNWFTIKVLRGFNQIIDFWHRYQTDSTRDGGTVEFSIDHGVIWQNMKGPCNSDSIFSDPGIFTTNFYTFNDTLASGTQAFTGTKSSTQYSRFQFFVGFPIGPLSGGSSGCDFRSADTIYVRFRFISDSVPDTMAGWIIDSIKIEQDDYGSGIVNINNQKSLNVYPNPSYDGSFTFPALVNEQNYKIEVYDAMGEKILKIPYTQSLELNHCPPGLYFYRVTGATGYYSGRLLIE